MPARPAPSRLTGPATRAMAAAAGISGKQLRHRDVVRLSRDTYVPRAAVDDVTVPVEAVLLTAPPGAVVSHRTAAAVWGLDIPLQRDDERVHLTVATGSAVRARADRCIHRCPLVPGEVDQRLGFHLTTPRRTWRDLAATLPPAALLAVTDQVLAAWCAPADLEEQLALRPAGRGSARARAVLPVADPRAESPMESVLRWLLQAAGVPAPLLQHPVRTPDGEFRADLAWPEHRVLVEFDGDLHRDRAVFVRDLRRQNALVAAGWTVLRFSSADVLGRPDEVVAQILRAPGAGERWTGPGTLVGVSRVVVDVVLKPEISDPQGQAVLGALGRLGHDSIRSVRQGKHFVLEVDGTPDEAELKQIAETLLANPVIEDVELHLPTD
ncbi:phosphoribosylformylglycinamidine synthase subunit PurS [Blastococcus sp. SYSU DS1024]